MDCERSAQRTVCYPQTNCLQRVPFLLAAQGCEQADGRPARLKALGWPSIRLFATRLSCKKPSFKYPHTNLFGLGRRPLKTFMEDNEELLRQGIVFEGMKILVRVSKQLLVTDPED